MYFIFLGFSNLNFKTYLLLLFILFIVVFLFILFYSIVIMLFLLNTIGLMLYFLNITFIYNLSYTLFCTKNIFKKCIFYFFLNIFFLRIYMNKLGGEKCRRNLDILAY